jgi:hypothetical protein
MWRRGTGFVRHCQGDLRRGAGVTFGAIYGESKHIIRL